MSASDLTLECEKIMFEAFDAIHALGVLHRYVRRQNILVGKNDKIWIIDFEFSSIVEEDPEREEILAQERKSIVQLLKD